jgi:putative addiction module component (TIGR02574 family)
MIRAEDELEAAALSLPRSERARLAERLLASLDDDSEIEQAWAEEVRQRLEQYRTGKIKTVPAAEVHEEARRRLKASRGS